MTEEEWLTSSSDYALYQSIRGQTSRRKLRLYACACCRQVWPLLVDARSRQAVDISERYADGLASKAMLSAAQGHASRAFELAAAQWEPLAKLVYFGLKGCSDVQRRDTWQSYYAAARRYQAARAAKAAARSTDRIKRMAEQMGLASQCSASASWIGIGLSVRERLDRANLLRCITGNLFSPPVSDSELTRLRTVRLAQAIYDECAFDRLPELADALERDGCTDKRILEHCRVPGTHARGCWVVDLILGKS